MKAPITTHVLNLDNGRPARGVEAVILRSTGSEWTVLDKSETDDDGRINSWLADYKLMEGTYRIIFSTEAYYKRKNMKTFYPQVTIGFHVDKLDEHYHVPLLLSRNGYSTYRGS